MAAAFERCHQTGIEFIVFVSKVYTFLLSSRSVLVNLAHLLLANDFVVLAADLTGQRTIMLEERNHVVVLVFLCLLGLVEASHSVDNKARGLFASQECPIGVRFVLCPAMLGG